MNPLLQVSRSVSQLAEEPEEVKCVNIMRTNTMGCWGRKKEDENNNTGCKEVKRVFVGKGIYTISSFMCHGRKKIIQFKINTRMSE